MERASTVECRAARRALGLLTAVGVATFCLAGPSAASSLTLGSGLFSPATCTPTCSGLFSAGSETGNINDTYSFTTLSGLLINGESATNTSVLAGQVISDFNIQLWSGTPGSSGDTLLANGFDGFSDSSFQFTGSITDTIGPGKYFIDVSGKGGSLGTTYAGSYAFAAAATPLPSAWTIMLIGVAGLGFLLSRVHRSDQMGGTAIA